MKHGDVIKVDMGRKNGIPFVGIVKIRGYATFVRDITGMETIYFERSDCVIRTNHPDDIKQYAMEALKK